MSLKTEYVWTKDDLRLQGMHYDSKGKKDLVVLFIHGMSGFFMENYFGEVLGESLSKNGWGFIYSHNRGYSHINDIVTKKIGKDDGYKTKRFGAVFERFEDCVWDIEAWVRKSIKLGYKRIILMGHSLGCPKTVYYLFKQGSKRIVGVILASPADMEGLVVKKEYQPDHAKLLKEARANIKAGKPKKILSNKIWDWYYLSSQTYLDLFEGNNAAGNFPVLRNPNRWHQLESVRVPILGIMGENDDIAIRSLKKDMDLIASKAAGAPSFDKKFIKKANHVYSRREKELAKTVSDWIKKRFG